MSEVSRAQIIEECAWLLELNGHPIPAGLVRTLHETAPAGIVKSDCQGEDPISILKEALRQANSYIDAIPIMPGNSYKDIKAVIRAALECDIHKDQAS